MFLTYDEVYEWIHSHVKFGIKPGLERMEWMLDKLGAPERELKAIHVGGTNGKGSTVTYLRSILNDASYQVGTFTSPAVVHFNERISVNGIPITDEEMIETASALYSITREMENTKVGAPTEFEIITAMAIYYFAKIRPVDIAILEVGLGGRFDSTNVIDPLLSIITNVGLDHTQILGDTIEKIAYEKAGIIKKETPVFTSVQSPIALNVIKEEAFKKKAPIFQLGEDFLISDYESVDNGEQFTLQFNQQTYKNLTTALIGEHQTKNAAGAVASLLHLHSKHIIDITLENIKNGLQFAYWPGRFEKLQEHPDIIIDGAHNPEGLEAFSEAINARYPDKKIHLVFAALDDKDINEMLNILSKTSAKIYLTQFDHPRASKVENIKENVNQNVMIYDNWQELLTSLVQTISKTDILAITGSLYFISQVKPFIVKVT
ncbi:bifunctional folylpolyglutamate synthase/dihydrofolate synthase [Pseudogracilibacillus auburnensis]|uniref:bifunctional folylpolyglutamate synthase/dihydrofolate synthase n=1 Tax=Pseudogracilibacillus auburnensis TaxID=1494959 RepID=UPI001A975FB8|nr:folylpolyglutamate synthase/dihydrofolate synthase family protein [Pseudogracilibacillus auburnensis]MBO1005591.1 bifunctional folylpolyglutamate synthase/dihydrofolate synthase [Pseudogracilibacillus auburnensis]